MWWCLWIVIFLNGSAGDSYVDFSDMGSYQYSAQSNYPSDSTNSLKEVSVKRATGPTGGSIIPVDGHYEDKGIIFLKRLVGSLLRQMNVRSHVFGPGEAITLDLQAEIFYEDMTILSDFLNDNNPDEYLPSVDRIFSNMIKVVPPPASSTFEFDARHFDVIYSIKFWLLLSTISIVIFLILTLSVRTVFARTPLQMTFYAFLILFVVSCVWTFADLYEDAKATGYAKIVQSQSVPKDCDFENLGFFHSLSYFFRVTIGGYKDRCEQYYESTMTDPLWNVNPLEAISKSFSVLVFAPMEYVGNKVGLFFKGVIQGVPFWLQPLLIFSLFFFVFFGLFGYTVRTPFMSIEPSGPRRPHLEGSGALVRVLTRNVATDTDDLHCRPSSPGQIPRSPHAATRLCIDFLQNCISSVISAGDFLLRQCPSGDVPHELDDEDMRWDAERHNHSVHVAANAVGVNVNPVRRMEAEEVFEDAEEEDAVLLLEEGDVVQLGGEMGPSSSAKRKGDGEE